MAQKTSINIKPCNIGSSEAHNRRTAEYLAHIGKEKFYVRTDLMAANETWVAPIVSKIIFRSKNIVRPISQLVEKQMNYS